MERVKIIILSLFFSLKTRLSQEIASPYVFLAKPLIPPFRKKPRFPWNRSSIPTWRNFHVVGVCKTLSTNAYNGRRKKRIKKRI